MRSSHHDATEPDFDLRIEGFTTADGTLPSGDAEGHWDKLRAAVASYRTAIKEELHEDSPILEVDIADICFLQPSCGGKFRDGRHLENTIHAIQAGRVDPMSHPSFCLNVAKAIVHSKGKGKGRRILYWSFDHRRLFAMRMAGCKRVRVKVKLSGEGFTEFANKAIQHLGTRRSIRIR